MISSLAPSLSTFTAQAGLLRAASASTTREDVIFFLCILRLNDSACMCIFVFVYVRVCVCAHTCEYDCTGKQEGQKSTLGVLGVVSQEPSTLVFGFSFLTFQVYE